MSFDFPSPRSRSVYQLGRVIAETDIIGQVKALHLYVNLKTTLYRVFEWFRVIFRYYIRNARFLWADMLLASQYTFKNPHRISRDFLKEKGEANIYQYGETPLTTLDKIARECRILSTDTVFELGCGSGRTLFWLASFVRCKAVGVEFVPSFVEKARFVRRHANLARIEVRMEDMLKTDLRQATFIYLYGTCLEEEAIEKLVQKFEKMPLGSHIISVSYPITDYSDQFEVEKQFEGRFPWGKAYLFLNRKC